jgi:acetamidase/formamidase
MAPMAVPTPTIHVAREQNHLSWDPAIAPVASVGSGEIVEFDCLDASFGLLTLWVAESSGFTRGDP